MPWGDSSKLQVGEWVLAIGSPFQLSQTVTAGIVSATGRANVGFADYEDFIQTDAAINPGNSGGALVNTRGELVGINTGIFSQSGGYQGIGFAVPSNLAQHVVDELMKFGEVQRGTIGGIVTIDRLTPQIAQEVGAPNDTAGALVIRMVRGSEAYEAGVRPGDVIVGFNSTRDRRSRRSSIGWSPTRRSARLRRSGCCATVDRWISRCRLCPTRAAAGKRAASGVLVAVLVACATSTAAAQALSISVRSRAVQPGEVVVVTVTAPRGADAVSVLALGTQWPACRIDETSWRALVGIDLEQHPGSYTLSARTAGVKSTSAPRMLTVLPRHFRTRTLSVAPDYVNPPPELLARISSEAEFMRTVYEQSGSAPEWRIGFTRPVPGQANSSFGTRSVFNGTPRSPHAGTDFLSGTGTPILARRPAAGSCAHAICSLRAIRW